MQVATTHVNTNHRSPSAGTFSISLTPSRAPTIDATAKTMARDHEDQERDRGESEHDDELDRVGPDEVVPQRADQDREQQETDACLKESSIESREEQPDDGPGLLS